MSRTFARPRAAFVAATPLASGRMSSRLSLESRCTTRPLIPVHTARCQRTQVPVTMGLFGLGGPEILVIAGVAILIFGPSKISELGKDLGGIAGGVKKASSEFKEAMEESLEEADREIEQKKIAKESASSKTVDTSASDVEPASEKKDA